MNSKDLAGKTFVVTGANTGIGKATVEALAARGAERIVIASRSKEKTEPVLAAIRAQGVKADFVGVELTDLASVKRAADEILAMDLPIDALINNAGIAGVQGITKDGFELAFGTNHVAHYLWTEKLLPLVKRAPQGRVVIVSSQGHYRASGIDWDAVRKTSATVTAFPEYCVSKLANVLHGKSLARRLSGTNVTTYSLHPGGVASDIWQRRLGGFAILLRPFLITNEKGARTQVFCATDPSVAKESGLYYDKERAKTPSKLALDVALQDELERRSREWVAPFF
jgi:dehydrogenase/reductase SDR family protein 13